jgi:hypothetical protein
MLSQAEKQDILEAAVMAIVTQGGPSYDDEEYCTYRAINGRRCAVGHFIDDQNYELKLEGRSVKDSIVSRALGASLGIDLEVDDVAFFITLQRAHDVFTQDSDEEDYFDRFSGRVHDLCTRYGLRFPEELFVSEHEDAARRLALCAAAQRSDCDMPPEIVSISRSELTDRTFVIKVDVRYSKKGYCALYGYRERDGDFSLYQD